MRIYLKIFICADFTVSQFPLLFTTIITHVFFHYYLFPSYNVFFSCKTVCWAVQSHIQPQELLTSCVVFAMLQMLSNIIIISFYWVIERSESESYHEGSQYYLFVYVVLKVSCKKHLYCFNILNIFKLHCCFNSFDYTKLKHQCGFEFCCNVKIYKKNCVGNRWYPEYRKQ